MEIETERLIVRSFRATDWQDLHAYLSLPSTYRFEPGDPIDTTQARALAEERSRGSNFLAVELKSEHRLVGHLYFGQVEDEAFRTRELGFIFNPPDQRRGYASESARAVVEHAFRRLDLHRVVASCHPDNVASWRTLERVGLLREGHLRRNVFFRRDAAGCPVWQDTYVYGLVNPYESDDRRPAP